MNMSYCRYENTLNDLKDCIEDAVKHINEEAKYSVDDREVRYFREMIKTMFQFLDFCEVIDYENCCLDENELDECCFRLEKGNSEE